MHTLLAPIDAIFSTLSSLCATLSAQFALLASHRLGVFGIAAVVVASLAVAVV